MKEKPNEYRINVTDYDGGPKDSYLAMENHYILHIMILWLKKDILKNLIKKQKQKNITGLILLLFFLLLNLKQLCVTIINNFKGFGVLLWMMNYYKN